MSGVPKRKRNESKFEVFHHWFFVRRQITDLMLLNFGYSPDKLERSINHRFQGRSYDKLSPDEQHHWDKWHEKEISFAEWFIPDERAYVSNLIREVTTRITLANDIWPTFEEELRARRLHQNAALGNCAAIKQELQYIAESLPVDINRYLLIVDEIDKEISMIRNWRKSDNKFRKNWANSDVSGNGDPNFANVNNNGNLNANQADNSNNAGVRADFDSHVNCTKNESSHARRKED